MELPDGTNAVCMIWPWALNQVAVPASGSCSIRIWCGSWMIRTSLVGSIVWLEVGWFSGSWLALSGDSQASRRAEETASVDALTSKKVSSEALTKKAV